MCRTTPVLTRAATKLGTNFEDYLAGGKLHSVVNITRPQDNAKAGAMRNFAHFCEESVY